MTNFIEFFKALKSWNAGGLQYPIDEAYQNLERAWNAGHQAGLEESLATEKLKAYNRGYEDGFYQRERMEEIL